MTKEIKYLLIFTVLLSAFNFKLNAQIKFRKDSCFYNSDRVFLKLPAFKNTFLKGKKSKECCAILFKNKEEFYMHFYKTEKHKLDSIVNLIDFDKNGALILLTSYGGCSSPQIDFYQLENKIQIYAQIDGGCYPLWHTSYIIIVAKSIFDYSEINIYSCEKWIKQ